VINRFFGCGKYRWLSYEALDRDLTPREEKFVARHECTCGRCEKHMSKGFAALNMLRGQALEASPKASFDERVLRRWRVISVRGSLGYWSPAMIGAAVAGLVILAALQMISQTSQLPAFSTPRGEARLATPAFPDTLDANTIRFLNQ